MSASDDGIAGDLAAARQAFEEAATSEEQLGLLDPVSPEEMVLAREALGPDAGRMSVVAHAREQRKAGRPPGSRNKATDDLRRYLLQFGEDPLIGAMRLATAQPEILIEASKQPKVHSFSKNGEPRMVIERMTYAEALAIQMRARELVAPYVWGKKPVAVIHDFSGIKDLVIEGVTHSRDEVRDIVDADFIRLEDIRGGDK